MNERIRQLARQAQVGSAEFGNGISYFVSTEETFNKFAELIVSECAQIARGNEDDTTARQIESRFGVVLKKAQEPLKRNGTIFEHPRLGIYQIEDEK
jgi:hypothetical protein